ncbi:ARM repeat superfamily protein [Abeliophyllum distichum]|uniref:ARM repeat superfamily protein n=1 Tax=Abeliophyllum distichum TaxID=126358 RepID=A0ABD1NQ41_9LAMI
MSSQLKCRAGSTFADSRREPKLKTCALVHHLRTAKTPQCAAARRRSPPQEDHWTLGPPVRRASANVVSIIAKYDVPGGEWPDLLPFLFQCSQSPQEDHREVCFSPAGAFAESDLSNFSNT